MAQLLDAAAVDGALDLAPGTVKSWMDREAFANRVVEQRRTVMLHRTTVEDFGRLLSPKQRTAARMRGLETLSQIDVARALEVSDRTIRNWERNPAFSLYQDQLEHEQNSRRGKSYDTETVRLVEARRDNAAHALCARSGCLYRWLGRADPRRWICRGLSALRPYLGSHSRSLRGRDYRSGYPDRPSGDRSAPSRHGGPTIRGSPPEQRRSHPPALSWRRRLMAGRSRLRRGWAGRVFQSRASPLLRKFLEVDGAASVDERIVEVHPEVSFRAMAGLSIQFPKRSWNGMLLRRRLLESNGILLPDELSDGGLAPADDVLDAAAAAWTAGRIAEEKARSLPDPPEKHPGGRTAAIWY